MTGIDEVGPVPPGPCWADSGIQWPGEKVTTRCDLRAGHAGAHEAERPWGGSAVWPNENEPHDVKFHVGTGTVVCTCGDYFKADNHSFAWPRDAVSKWAEHVRETRVIPSGEGEAL